MQSVTTRVSPVELEALIEHYDRCFDEPIAQTCKRQLIEMDTVCDLIYSVGDSNKHLAKEGTASGLRTEARCKLTQFTQEIKTMMSLTTLTTRS